MEVLSVDKIEFDFEKDVDKMLPEVFEANQAHQTMGTFRMAEQKRRVVVCTHWLAGLCMRGSDCSFLHMIDKNRMPVCKHGNLCKIHNCPLKHIAEDQMEECLFYKQGFCYHGPKCTRRHVKRMPEDCPAEATFEAINFAPGTVTGKQIKTAEPNDNFKVSLCTHFLMNGVCPYDPKCHYAHGEDELNEGYQPNIEFLNDSGVYDPTAGRLDCTLELPFPTGTKCSYFMLQAPDLRSLAVARRRGVWAVPMRIVAEINAAARASEHVLLFFVVRSLRGLYGVATLAGPIPPPMNPMSPMSGEFAIHWLRSVRVTLKTIAQLKMGTTGVFLGRCAMDGRFDNKIGMDILLVCYRKPAWEWLRELEKAEKGIRLSPDALLRTVASTGGSQLTINCEYFPANGESSYYLPPDVLFPPDWIERAGIIPNDKGMIIQHRSNSVRVGGVTGAGAAASAGGGMGNSSAFSMPQPVANFYTGELPGFIFVANAQVMEEMMGRGLFGLHEQMQGVPIHANAPLFLFNVTTQTIFGIFNANSPIVYNMEPMAFTQWGPPLPIQLRFRIALESPGIPIQDPELAAALGNNFNFGPISLQETKNLANLFMKRTNPAILQHAGLLQVAGVPGGPGAPGGVMGLAGPGGIGTHTGTYKPPYKFVEVVPIGIEGNQFQVKKRLLGMNSINVMTIVEELGSKQNIRIRLRGVGSGFTEGPGGQELPEPLHFNVCADSEELLQAVLNRIRQLIENTRNGGGGGY